MSAGRYKVVDQPLALPGSCYLTGAAGEASGPYIDSGQSIRGHGAVYFSAQAIEEMYRELKAHQGIDISKSLEETEREVAKAEGYAKGYVAGVDYVEDIFKEEILNDLARVVANRSAGLDPFAPASDESEDVPEDAGKPEGSESGSDGTSESNSPSSGSSGRSRVSKRASNVDAADDDDLGLVL